MPACCTAGSCAVMLAGGAPVVATPITLRFRGVLNPCKQLKGGKTGFGQGLRMGLAAGAVPGGVGDKAGWQGLGGTGHVHLLSLAADPT